MECQNKKQKNESIQEESPLSIKALIDLDFLEQDNNWSTSEKKINRSYLDCAQDKRIPSLGGKVYKFDSDSDSLPS